MVNQSITSRLKHAWNAFTNRENEYTSPRVFGPSYSVRPDRIRTRGGGEKSIVTSIITRISIDASDASFRHVRLDEEDRYVQDLKTSLNYCLTVEANIDQAATQFHQDVFNTMLEEGTVAIVPVDTTTDPTDSTAFDIQSMRVGKIIQWRPQHIRVSLYNEDPKVGEREEIWVPKRTTAIVENPLYAVMNERNSILQRLIHKLHLLDVIDEQSSSGKLDIIIQLPFVVRGETRKQQAEDRRKAIEVQLTDSKYGIAYADAAEKITQLNRPAENNMLAQVTYLTNMLYGQLGVTEDIINGTADEKTMLNYHNRTINPLINAYLEAMRRAFLSKTAKTQKQSIIGLRDPFKFVPISQVAEIADKFTRNKIATANEFRGAIGWKPSKDPSADKLENSNMPEKDQTSSEPAIPKKQGDLENQKVNEEGNLQNGSV